MAGTSKPSTGSTYEVFLSFRGPDTRNTFTGHLYNALEGAGIYTFIDNERLHTGEKIGPELLSAIEESRISIPIFSKNYASSKWCLNELVKMVECSKNMNQTILPIFYDVDPSTVRNQTGSYAEAFEKHSESVRDQTIVDAWRAALREAGELKGWDLKEIDNGHEATLVRLVVEYVSSISRKDSQIILADLIGIESHVKQMVKKLNITLEDRKIVGIRGLGGIGKTTIAKVVYNTISHHFDGCSFLANIRGTAVVDLQNQLLSNILKGVSPNITGINEGINLIRQRLCRKKVLIVLDDVDKKDQLDALMNKRDWFGLGSRIIITTRDEHVWANQVVDEIYEPKEMDANQSLKLFSKHAFKEDQPPDERLDLSIDIVKKIGGLPLALEVIGASLFGTSESFWRDTLKMLQDGILDDEIMEKLKISFDRLNDTEKEIFLDIACFFNEMDINIACFIWQQCNFSPERGIHVLCQKSLVKIGVNNELKMHDLLRDLGKEIIRQENRKVPGGRSRLWSHKEALDVLDKHSGTDKVEGMCIDFGGSSSSRLCLTSEGFTKLTKLRLLQVDYAQFAPNFDLPFSELIWFRWKGCPQQFALWNFHPMNLVVLDLSDSLFTNLWKGWNYIKVAKNLKVLNLARCQHLLRTPKLGNPRLEVLIFEGCRGLVEIDGSINYLNSLVTLNLRGCNKLSELPHGTLGLTSLKNLNLHLCEGLGGLPDYMDLLGNLETLDASFCYMPKKGKREDGMVHWPSFLKTLMLGGNNFRSLQVSALSSLQTLDLRFCGELESLPVLPSSLKYLNLLRCSSLNSLLTLSNMTELVVLCLDDCENLVELSDLSGMRNLEKLSLDNCKSLIGIAGLDGLDSLQQLTMKNCKSLTNIGKVRLPKLEELRFVGCSCLWRLQIEGCETLFEIESFEGLHSLRWLEIAACTSLTQIGELSNLEELEILKILYCKSMERLPDISKLRKLRTLSTAGCFNLKEIQGLDKLKSLEEWDLSWCDFLERAKLPERFSDCRQQERYEKHPERAETLTARVCFLKMIMPWVRLESHVEKILKLMNVALAPSDVKIVGISGRDVIGKTSIVKLVYDTIAHDFRECVFLRSSLGPNRLGLDHVKGQRLQDVFTVERYVGYGKLMLDLIYERLHHVKALVVLDDVSDTLQLDALMRLRERCGLGSRIIVTTTYPSMLECHDVDVRYQLDDLDVDKKRKKKKKRRRLDDLTWMWD